MVVIDYVSMRKSQREIGGEGGERQTGIGAFATEAGLSRGEAEVLEEDGEVCEP